MLSGRPTSLTVERILALGEERLASYYLNQPVSAGEVICNPLRDDRNASLSIRWDQRNGKLKFKDFTGWLEGDVIDLVAKKYSTNYQGALYQIWSDFRKEFDARFPPGSGPPGPGERRTKHPPRKKSNTVIQYRTRKATKADVNYWLGFGIRPSTLEFFQVFPLRELYINGKINYRYHPSDPGFIYLFQGGRYVKAYFPKRIRSGDRRPKFLGNAEKKVLQGFDQFTKLHSKENTEDYPLIFTKSLKDVMTLYELGVHSLAPQSEDGKLNVEVMKPFKNYTERYALFDADSAGISGLKTLRERFSFKPLLIRDPETKDISDYVKHYGKKVAKEMVEQKWKEYVERVG